MQEREPEYAQDLVKNIVSKASDVFLWVRLVVSSLLAGIGHGDRIIDFQARLDLLLPELEQLYDKMLDSVDPFYLERAAQLLNFVEEYLEPSSVLLMSFGDEEHLEFSLKRPIEPTSQKQAGSRIDTMRCRLNVCTKGPLEVAGAPFHLEQESDINQADSRTVQYLHRTVKDYMKSPQVQNRLISFMKTPFDCHLMLCASNLAYLKANGPNLIKSIDHSFCWIRIK